MIDDEHNSTEPFLLVEKCGSARGVPIYVITKYIPVKAGYPSRTREIRCMDLADEALGGKKAMQGGCSQIQFFNEVDYLRCTKCDMDFSKFYLKQNIYIEVRGLPN